ncbi:MAG: ABC transporter permease [Phycisphaerales bacterium JB043]
MGRLNEIKELTRVRALGLFREPEAVFWVFVFPLVLAGVLGFAFRTGSPQPASIAIVQNEQTQRLQEILAVDELLEVEVFETFDDAYVRVRNGAVDGIVQLDDPPKLTFDPVRPDSEVARLRVLRALALDAGQTDPALEELPVTEKGSRYVDFLFPGLLGMNLMGTGMWGVGFAIADVRRRKFLRRMLVTPMRRSSFLLSFVLSRLVFLVFELIILTSFGIWVLGIPLRGNILSFVIVCAMGAMLFAALGVLVASRARTIEGVSGLMNFAMVPMWLASGVFFSYERFPDALHPLIRLLPLTGLNDALRAIMIDGASLISQWSELLMMGVWTALCVVVALKIFRWD